jgi:hypothetical protein
MLSEAKASLNILGDLSYRSDHRCIIGAVAGPYSLHSCFAQDDIALKISDCEMF